MEAFVGKYILVEYTFKNGDVERYLRYINRENKKYYISDVQRFCPHKTDKSKYTFVYRWSAKFFKTKDGFIISNYKRLLKNNIQVKTTLLDSADKYKCTYSFDELFNTDLRKLQDKNDSPLCYRLGLTDEELENVKENYFNLWLFDKSNDSDYFYNKLKEIFKVSTVYRTDEITEYDQKILTKSSTLFQFTFSGDYKKKIDRIENYENRTISYWLFNDCLIFHGNSMKKTW